MHLDNVMHHCIITGLLACHVFNFGKAVLNGFLSVKLHLVVTGTWDHTAENGQVHDIIVVVIGSVSVRSTLLCNMSRTVVICRVSQTYLVSF